MSEEQESDTPPQIAIYGLLIAVVVIYGTLFIGGFVAVFYSVAWLDMNVLQPMVGGSEMLSLALFVSVILLFLWTVFRFGMSGTRRVVENAAPSSIFNMNEIDDD